MRCTNEGEPLPSSAAAGALTPEIWATLWGPTTKCVLHHCNNSRLGTTKSSFDPKRGLFFGWPSPRHSPSWAARPSLLPPTQMRAPGGGGACVPQRFDRRTFPPIIPLRKSRTTANCFMFFAPPRTDQVAIIPNRAATSRRHQNTYTNLVVSPPRSHRVQIGEGARAGALVASQATSSACANNHSTLGVRSTAKSYNCCGLISGCHHKTSFAQAKAKE